MAAITIQFDALGLHRMLRHWYQWLLVAVLAFSATLAIGYLVYRISYYLITKFRKGRVGFPPADTREFLQKLSKTAKKVLPQPTNSNDGKHTSFGVYLGSFEYPPTEDQARILSLWDAIIVDPLQKGVAEAVSNTDLCTSNYVIARFDIDSLTSRYDKSERVEMLRSITSLVLSSFSPQSGTNDRVPYNGILIANWDSKFSVGMCNELISFLMSLNINVYTEIREPRFMDDDNQINVKPLTGIVFVNGAIMSDGSRRDYFQALPMKKALQVVAAQSCIREFAIMMFDVVDDGVEVSNAVMERTFKWCNFYGALVWVGTRKALVDATMNFRAEKPDGAFDWLKMENVIDIQDIWRLNAEVTNEPVHDPSVYHSLEDVIPGISKNLTLYEHTYEDKIGSEHNSQLVQQFDWVSKVIFRTVDPLSTSSHGLDYTGLGCFPIGMHVSQSDFDTLLSTQKRLHSLNLLKPVEQEALYKIGLSIREFVTNEPKGKWTDSSNDIAIIRQLADLLCVDDATDEDRGLKVYLGLDTSFRSTDQSSQFWGIYDIEDHCIRLYISQKATDLGGTILHTFMSSQYCTRSRCTAAEIAFAEFLGSSSEPSGLPLRINNDIEMLTPAESLNFLQGIAISGNTSPIVTKIRAKCEYQLIDVPSSEQLKKLNTIKYLSGTISVEELVASRLWWYQQNKVALMPRLDAAVELFNTVDRQIVQILRHKLRPQQNAILTILREVIERNKIDVRADIFALSIFCALRKAAFEIVYLDATDRCALLADQPDQLAVFAELWAIGSHCESYLDLVPKALGNLLLDKYRTYYKKNQPPLKVDDPRSLPTAYASAQTDSDHLGEAGNSNSLFQRTKRMSYLGVYAVPALVDILLLTTIGRGLYLSAAMSETELEMSTYALVVALLLCGAVSNVICCGGSYYLYATVYPTMNMFMVTRLVGGVAFVCAASVISFVVTGLVRGFYAGAIFILYLLVLSIYLFTLGMMANLQFPGSPLPSGRTAIGQCLLLLLISPILSSYVGGHDIVIYLSVLWGFVIIFILQARRVISRWNNWLQNLPSMTDDQIMDWYIKQFHRGDREAGFKGLSAPASMDLARKTLYAAVKVERAKPIWMKSTSDEDVKKLADAFPTTMFLLNWYSRFMKSTRPLPYTSTWNLQIVVALNTVRDYDKGLRLHNGFIHWRNACKEMGCGVLYFVVALLDRWIELFCGGRLIGITLLGEGLSRVSVGLALAYYLFGAVVLDIHVQPLYEKVKQCSVERLKSAEHLNEIAKVDSRNKRRLYWGTLLRVVLVHMWGLAFTAAGLWAYVDTGPGIIIFFAYIGSYTGLLWYQYNKVFVGQEVIVPLVIATLAGFGIGIPLRLIFPNRYYNDILALAIACWIAGFLTFFQAGLRAPKFEDDKTKGQKKGGKSSSLGYQPAIGKDTKPSAKHLLELFDNLANLPPNQRFKLDGHNPIMIEVMSILNIAMKASKAHLLTRAFPQGKKLLDQLVAGIKSDATTIELVSLKHMVSNDYDVRAVCQSHEKGFRIIVGIDVNGNDWMNNLNADALQIAEALIHVVFDSKFDHFSKDSSLAELLVSRFEDVRVPRRIQHQLEISSMQELYEILHSRDANLLPELLFGMDPDRDWESLPTDIRVVLIKRVCGEPYELTASQVEWMKQKLVKDQTLSIDAYLARRDLSASLIVLVDELAGSFLHEPNQKRRQLRRHVRAPSTTEIELEVAPDPPNRGYFGMIAVPFISVGRIMHIFIKFLTLALIAEPEFQRELAYVLKRRWLRKMVMFLYACIWIYSKWFQSIAIPFFMFYRRPHMAKLASVMRKGIRTVIHKERVVIHNINGIITGFIETAQDGSVALSLYNGDHTHIPKQNDSLVAINYYTADLRISRREEWSKGEIVNEFLYEYPNFTRQSMQFRKRLQSSFTKLLKVPMSRVCIRGTLEGQRLVYNKKGFVKSGTAIRDGVEFDFTYQYRKKAKFDDELLRVDYVFNLTNGNQVKANVWWCVPPARHVEKLDKWIPYYKVTQATFTDGDIVYETKWSYDHKCHPTLSTLLNGKDVETPEMVRDDHLNVLNKPIGNNFMAEDPLFSFSSIRFGFIKRCLRLNKRYRPITTSSARTYLWRKWKESSLYDGVTARYLDELALRSDPVLKPYWRARDVGNIHKAIKYLRLHGDAIMASVDIDHDVSAWTALAYKMSDLFSLGQGGDTSINTRTSTNQIDDGGESLHVLATDTGTWPCEGGGVSCCRRDLVNNLQKLKWHVIAETANDYSIPRFQIEQNVQSIKILPQWGLDFLTPTHGIIENLLDSEVNEKIMDTNDKDIKEKFLPVLETLVEGVRSIEYNPENVERYSTMLVKLNAYFEKRSWNYVWNNKIVKRKWQELWLSKSNSNSRPIEEWLDIEKPTLTHLADALELYSRYLFVFSIPVPEYIPTVFQASHHSVGSMYGIICKLKRRCTFQVWDHSIIWRECNTYLSAAQCSHPPFVRNSLVSLMRLAAQLTLHHADVILPCTNFFNPGWEVEIGTCEGVISHRRKFVRKIDPVVNGICDMEKFEPIEKICTDKPTVTMLSHVQYVKDIKTAILAADIIVNHWGFKDYRLNIYGGLDRNPPYTVECQELLAAKALRGYVTLKGYGNPSKVLADTWVFLNSSISEGLPLAIGEAALTGAPIVCTDVGATFQVLSDPDYPKKLYGAVVAPNDIEALAREQIKLLAVMGQWTEYAEDDEQYMPLPEHFTPDDVQRITSRMYEKTPQRRKLGLELRKIVKRNFAGDRYLREHEQMLWIGKYHNEVVRETIATVNNDTIVDMLDDRFTAVENQEYRPEFMRYMSGFSAFNSSLTSATPSDDGTGSSFIMARRSQFNSAGPSRLQSSIDLEKGYDDEKDYISEGDLEKVDERILDRL